VQPNLCFLRISGLPTDAVILLLVTHVGRAETRTLTLDYGYTPEALLNNFELLGA
jgi:hypothetical protein